MNYQKIDPKITIIVPVYNVEKYLSRCIESIIHQSYTNWELILIDDGSRDSSGNICDKYAKLNNKINVIHKKNNGVSSARNEGIKHSNSELICFVDSDDWLPTNSLTDLVSDYKKEGAELTIGNYDYREYKISYDKLENCIVDFDKLNDENLEYFLLSHVSHAPWCKLFKLSIILENKLLFDEQIKYGEDALFIRQYVMYCNKISMINSIVYHYNLLNSGAASLKYYEQKNEWLLSTIKQLDILMKEKLISEEKRKKILSIKSFSIFINSISQPIKKFNKTKAELFIKNTIDFFGDYIILDVSWISEKDKRKEILISLINKDVKKIYFYCKKYINYGRYKKIIKKQLIRLQKRKLYKRDNLLKYRG